MASGPWTTRRADISRALALLVFAAAGSTLHAGTCAATSGAAALKPVYLTFDTGHMAVAPLIADVLK